MRTRASRDGWPNWPLRMLNARPSETVRFLVRHLGVDLPAGRRVGLVAFNARQPGHRQAQRA